MARSTWGGRRSRPARPRSASRRSGRRSSCVAALPAARIIVLGPAGPDEFAAAREARLELCLSAGTAPPDVPVHLKLDTGMGRWGLSELAAPGLGRRRPDEPLRDGRHRRRVHRAAAGALPRGHRAVRAPDAPHREQRRHAASSRIAPRRGPLRDRGVRHLALRHRPGRRRPAPGAALGVHRRRS